VVVECTPNIKKIGEAKSVDDGYLVCTVNSFISDKLKPYDFAKGDDYHSYTRYSFTLSAIYPFATAPSSIPIPSFLKRSLFPLSSTSS